MSYMMTEKKPFVVLMAEDSEHDVRAVRRVWDRAGIRNTLKVVSDGEECLDYLLRRGKYHDPGDSPRPGALLLDLNMPKLTGLEVLRVIKSTPALQRLPVVVLTTSGREEDMAKSYDLGANAFMTKPVGLEKMSEALLRFNHFWEMVSQPEDPDGRSNSRGS